MADILSQEEVDLLLNAVQAGEGETEEQDFDRVDTREMFSYDFRRPERVSKQQLKGLQSLFEAFARELSILMPPYLRTVVRVDLSSIDQLTYDEFILSVSRPTSLSIIDMAPLDGNAVIELSPGIVFPIVDRILGGKGGALSKPRELTEIENRIIHRIVTMILDCLKRSWEQLVEFHLTIAAQESDPLIVQIVAGSEMVILVGYEMHVGGTTGSMNACIPLVVLNPILDQISQQTRFKRKMPPEEARRMRTQITKAIRKASVPVDAILGHAHLPLDELARLVVGDIIQLNTSAEDPITVEVGGIEEYQARTGRRGEQSAIQLSEIVREEEGVEELA